MKVLCGHFRAMQSAEGQAPRRRGYHQQIAVEFQPSPCRAKPIRSAPTVMLADSQASRSLCRVLEMMNIHEADAVAVLVPPAVDDVR